MNVGPLRMLQGVALASSALLVSPVDAQPPGPRPVAPPATATAPQPGQPATAKPEKEESKIPPAEDITLETDDRVLLRATWFPGTREKQAVPIILLHDGKGNRSQMTDLAKYLQLQGHAALALDLRGFGQSTSSAINPSIKYDHEKFRPADYGAFIAQDLEAAKRFLMEKNNAGELNIDMLTIIAAGETSAVALNWAVQDWSWPDLLNRKQGKDVKALILLSPERKWESINAGPSLLHPSMGYMAFLIAAGSESRASAEADKVHAQLEKSHPAPPGAQDDTKLQTLVMVEVPTKVQGAQLIDPRLRLGVERDIAKFIKEKLTDNAAVYSWQDRTPKD